VLSPELIAVLAIAVSAAAPIIIAAIGETLSERAGVINLSADGVLLLAGLAGFVAAQATGNVLPGFAAAAAVGAAVAAVVAFGSVTLGQSQTAIGFVLALLCTDLSSFLGAPYVLTDAPRVPPRLPIPILADIPVIGPIFFNTSLTVYFSYALVLLTWLFVYRTRVGLLLRAMGEQPAAAFARGVNLIRGRYLYTMLGGALVGIAGAAFTLDIKAGWTFRHVAGYGWIALALVIFGGWNPLRVAIGAWLFGVIQSLLSNSDLALTQTIGNVLPTQVLPILPFVFMILVLVVSSSDLVDRATRFFPLNVRRVILRAFRTPPPAALGKPFEQD
jgi:general nucleoside transport system permease protein